MGGCNFNPLLPCPAHWLIHAGLFLGRGEGDGEGDVDILGRVRGMVISGLR